MEVDGIEWVTLYSIPSSLVSLHCHRAAAGLQITGVYRAGGGGSAGGGGWWGGWLLAPHHRSCACRPQSKAGGASQPQIYPATWTCPPRSSHAIASVLYSGLSDTDLTSKMQICEKIFRNLIKQAVNSEGKLQGGCLFWYGKAHQYFPNQYPLLMSLSLLIVSGVRPVYLL